MLRELTCMRCHPYGDCGSCDSDNYSAKREREARMYE
jgi:hypothetical protein